MLYKVRHTQFVSFQRTKAYCILAYKYEEYEHASSVYMYVRDILGEQHFRRKASLITKTKIMDSAKALEYVEKQSTFRRSKIAATNTNRKKLETTHLEVSTCSIYA